MEFNCIAPLIADFTTCLLFLKSNRRGFLCVSTCIQLFAAGVNNPLPVSTFLGQCQLSFYYQTLNMVDSLLMLLQMSNSFPFVELREKIFLYVYRYCKFSESRSPTLICYILVFNSVSACIGFIYQTCFIRLSITLFLFMLSIQDIFSM